MTRRKFSAEEKIRIVLEGLRGEESIAELCRREGIVQLVEHSYLPVRRTLVKLGIPRATFYRWYDLYHTGGLDALGDRFSACLIFSPGDSPSPLSPPYLPYAPKRGPKSVTLREHRA